MFDFGITEIGILSMIGAAWWLKDKNKLKGVLTPERKVIFETAYRELRDSTKLRKLADVFEQQGLHTESNILRKRASLRELPPEVKAQRKMVFKKAMSSQNPEAIEFVAHAFAGEGALGAASALRKYADTLRNIPPDPASPPAGDDESTA